MSLRINDEAPNFQAQTTEGPIDFHRWIGGGWALRCKAPFAPKTPVQRPISFAPPAIDTVWTTLSGALTRLRRLALVA
jgi:hypothetical protein